MKMGVRFAENEDEPHVRKYTVTMPTRVEETQLPPAILTDDSSGRERRDATVSDAADIDRTHPKSLRAGARSVWAAQSLVRGLSGSHWNWHRGLLKKCVSLTLRFEKRMTLSWEGIDGVLRPGKCEVRGRPFLHTASQRSNRTNARLRRPRTQHCRAPALDRALLGVWLVRRS
jgi:hypothetical protein